MWECQWKRYHQSSGVVIHNPYKYSTENEFRMDEQDVIDYIRDGKIFGAVEVDLEVPNHLKHKFRDMPPIFKNTGTKENSC